MMYTVETGSGAMILYKYIKFHKDRFRQSKANRGIHRHTKSTEIA
jgi:hypothetical protein